MYTLCTFEDVGDFRAYVISKPITLFKLQIRVVIALSTLGHVYTKILWVGAQRNGVF